MTEKELTEYLFQRGLMPSWAYYQLNGKSAADNYRDQYYRLQERERAERDLLEYKARRKAEIDTEIEKQIEDELAPKVERTIEELFQEWL